MVLLLLLLLVVVLIDVIKCNECTDNCDVTYTTGLKLKFCGTDNITHNTYYGAIDNKCYFNCGIMALYSGSCSCPNDCNSDFNQGSCLDNNSCLCNDSWTGVDCSIPSISNECSNHGKIITSSNDIPTPYCKCDDNFTGTDCSVPVFNLGNAPWGDVIDNEYHGDEYGDNHPIFNVSVFATIKLSLSKDDYLYQLERENAFNASYKTANITFDNGNYRQYYSNIAVKIKGAYSRMDMKKGWAIDLNHYVKGQDFYGVNRLNLKPGGDDDDVLLKNLLYTNFQRAVGVPVERGSYALLYINDIFVGLYYMHEQVDNNFVASRYKNDDGNGNLFKMNRDVFLTYLGSNVSTYQEAHGYYSSGDIQYSYELSSSVTDDWSDLVDILSYLNTTTDLEQFQNTIEDRIDVDMLLKGLVIESFLMGVDGYLDGHNYYFVHSNNKDTPQK